MAKKNEDLAENFTQLFQILQKIQILGLIIYKTQEEESVPFHFSTNTIYNVPGHS